MLSQEKRSIYTLERETLVEMDQYLLPRLPQVRLNYAVLSKVKTEHGNGTKLPLILSRSPLLSSK